MSSNVHTPSMKDGRELAKVSTLNGQHLRCLIEASLTWLKTNQQTVNALNVFPVPDGDTGTNMVLTLQSAYNDIIDSDETNIGKMAHMMAQGALMGARGNSGVILSQIMRGFARAMDNFETADLSIIVAALAEARDTAYKGVVRPVEGTILTVAKDVAEAGKQALPEARTIMELLELVVRAADESVQRTPELLPILKQAGVVDSGGKGLYFILEGMYRYLSGQTLETPVSTVQPLEAMKIDNAMETIEPGQDYEVVIDFRPAHPLDLEQFYNDLSEMGTSIQLGEGDGIYRMHIHVPTENRYLPIDYTMNLGTVTKIAIENLLAQMEHGEEQAEKPELELFEAEPDQIAVVAVSPGYGISRIFASLGASAIVEGGQTMNPSTEEIYRAIESLQSNNVIILPNNKNIVMAAQSAASMSSKRVAVIPTRSSPQGLSAMLRLDHDGDFDEIVSEMKEAMTEVETGEITIATRTVEMNGVQVNQGEVIALLNGELIESDENLEKATLALLRKANTDERERITLFYGADITRPKVNEIVDLIRQEYPTHEIELHQGGQPHYQLILSIE